MIKNTVKYKLNKVELDALIGVILHKVPFVIAGTVNKDDRNPLKTLAPTLFPILTDNMINIGMPARYQDIPIDDDKKVSVFYCNLLFGIEKEGGLKEVYTQVAEMLIDKIKKGML